MDFSERLAEHPPSTNVSTSSSGMQTANADKFILWSVERLMNWTKACLLSVKNYELECVIWCVGREYWRSVIELLKPHHSTERRESKPQNHTRRYTKSVGILGS